jgi:hypothetical protein
MATVIDSLVVELGLDPTKFTQGQSNALGQLRRFEQEALSSSKRLESTGAAISEAFSGFQKTALGLVATFLGGMGIKEFTGYITNLDAATGRIARTMDISSRELSSWQGAAELAGGSAQGITGTLQGLSSEMQNFSLTGRTNLLGPLTQLGVSLNNANGQLKTSTELFLDIADAVNGMDPARARAILSMLGMDQDSINLALQGRSALEANLAILRQTGGTTEQSARAAQEYQRSLALLGRTATDAGRALFNIVAPDLTKSLQGITALINEAKKLKELSAGGHGDKAAQSFATRFGNLFLSSFKASTGIDWAAFTDWVNEKTGGALGTALGGNPSKDQINHAQALDAFRSAIGLDGSSGNLDVYAQAIANIESSGGNYRAIGPTVPSGRHAGERAYGKYQVLQSNIAAWTQEAVGRSMTPEEFRNDPDAQEAVFRLKFGQLAQKYGASEAARRWLGTGPRDLATGMTGDDYVNRFNAYVSAHLPPSVGAAEAAQSSVTNQSNRGGDTTTTSHQTTIQEMNVNVPNANDASRVVTNVNKTIDQQSGIATWNTGQQ